MNHSLDNTLARLGRELNRANIFWAVGGSVMLQQYSLINQPKDIDILVTGNDLQRACEILHSLGNMVAKREKDEIFATDFFCEYKIDGFEVDLISGLKIKKDNKVFEYNFEPLTPRVFFTIEDEQIPFCTLEDWHDLYGWMPNKEEKVTLIKEYLKIV